MLSKIYKVGFIAAMVIILVCATKHSDEWEKKRWEVHTSYVSTNTRNFCEYLVDKYDIDDCTQQTILSDCLLFFRLHSAKEMRELQLNPVDGEIAAQEFNNEKEILFLLKKSDERKAMNK